MMMIVKYQKLLLALGIVAAAVLVTHSLSKTKTASQTRVGTRLIRSGQINFAR